MNGIRWLSSTNYIDNKWLMFSLSCDTSDPSLYRCCGFAGVAVCYLMLRRLIMSPPSSSCLLLNHTWSHLLPREVSSFFTSFSLAAVVFLSPDPRGFFFCHTPDWITLSNLHAFVQCAKHKCLIICWCKWHISFNAQRGLMMEQVSQDWQDY